jgi:hypothetical protein
MNVFSAISWQEQVKFRQDDVQHSNYDFYSASSLKQSMGTHVILFGYTILTQNQPVISLTP